MNSCAARVMVLCRASLGPVIPRIKSEAHVAGLAGDQPAVGDGGAVGVAREVGEHGVEPAERRLGCGENSVLSTVVRGYDLRKSGGHLGNVG